MWWSLDAAVPTFTQHTGLVSCAVTPSGQVVRPWVHIDNSFCPVLCRCYADTMPRQLPLLLGGDPATMTVAECARRTRERYLTVFALQYGGECFGCECLQQS